MNSTCFTDISLTLGNWGRAPLTVERQRRILRTLANWLSRSGMAVRTEVYVRPEPQLALIEEWAAKADALTLVVREEPRSDRFRRIAGAGAGHVVFEMPVSHQAAAIRFRPHGVDQTRSFAATAAREAVLAGLIPEIALIDIARANQPDVMMLVDRVFEMVRPYDAEVRWRLVDSSGWADPAPDAQPPRSLPAWIRLLQKEFAIQPETITVQCADTLGHANASTLDAMSAGTSAATSLFGLGMGSGWAATEIVLAEAGVDDSGLKPLFDLRGLLTGDEPAGVNPAGGFNYKRVANQPVSATRRLQFPGGASPENPSKELLDAWFPLPPEFLSPEDPEPLLTALSGHAGLLHLMHRQWPELHFDTDDSRAHAISEAFEAEFGAGRQIPVSWNELLPRVIAAGLCRG